MYLSDLERNINKTLLSVQYSERKCDAHDIDFKWLKGNIYVSINHHGMPVGNWENILVTNNVWRGLIRFEPKFYS